MPLRHGPLQARGAEPGGPRRRPRRGLSSRRRGEPAGVVTQRLLLLLPSTTYRADAFSSACRRLPVEVDVVTATDGEVTLPDGGARGALSIPFDPDQGLPPLLDYARRHPVSAVIGVDDLPLGDDGRHRFPSGFPAGLSRPEFLFGSKVWRGLRRLPGCNAVAYFRSPFSRLPSNSDSRRRRRAFPDRRHPGRSRGR